MHRDTGEKKVVNISKLNEANAKFESMSESEIISSDDEVQVGGGSA